MSFQCQNDLNTENLALAQAGSTSPTKSDSSALPSNISPQRPRGAQTITNNLAPVKDTNLRGMEGVETVKVANMTGSTSLPKSLGSIFSSINKQVSGAFSSIMSFQQQQAMAGPGGPGNMAGGQAGYPGSGPSGGFRTQGVHHPPPQQPITPFKSSNPSVVTASQMSIPAKPSATRDSTALSSLTGNSPHTPRLQPPASPTPRARAPNSPTLPRAAASRSPSPFSDIGFSGAVTNIVDQAHQIAERDRMQRYGRKGRIIVRLHFFTKLTLGQVTNVIYFPMSIAVTQLQGHLNHG